MDRLGKSDTMHSNSNSILSNNTSELGQWQLCTSLLLAYANATLLNFFLWWLPLDSTSVLDIRGNYYQGWFMYMRYTQGQNEEYLSSDVHEVSTGTE